MWVRVYAKAKVVSKAKGLHILLPLISAGGCTGSFVQKEGFVAEAKTKGEGGREGEGKERWWE